MQNGIRRLAIALVVTALAGCASRTSSSLPATPAQNTAGVATRTTTTQEALKASAGTSPAFTLPARLLDAGALGPIAPAARYVGVGVSATDHRSPLNSAADTVAGSLAAPKEPAAATDTGSHSIAIAGFTTARAVITSNQSYDLSYALGGKTLNYSTLVAHFAVSGSALPTGVSVEIVGGTGAGAYDVRARCTGAAPLTSNFGRFACPIPPYGSFATAALTDPIAAAAHGAFAPTAARLYFVFSYAAVPAPHTTTMLGIDNVYLAQCAGANGCSSRPVALATPMPQPGWPSLGQNAQHTAYINDPNMNVSVAPTLGVHWMTSINTADLGSPIAAPNASNQTIAYAGNERGDVFAFNESSAALQYSASLGVGNALRGTPLYVGDGSLWVGTNFNPSLDKLNAGTGAKLCSTKQPLPIMASAIMAIPPSGVETVYDSTVDGVNSGPWFGLNEGNCSTIFSFTGYRTTAGPWASTAYGVSAGGEGIVVVGTSDPDSTEYALDASSGQLLWEFKVQNPPPYSYDIGAAATISYPGVNGFADGVVYFPTKYGILYALDLTTGALIWQLDFNQIAGTTHGGRSSAALDGSTLVFGYAGGVFAVNAITGQPIWQYQDPSGTEVLSSPAIVGPPGAEVVACADVSGAFHVLSLASGAELYHYQTGGFVSASPAYVNGHFLLTSSDGFLYDFAPGGANGANPTTTIVSPAPSSIVSNPNGPLTISGTATDSTSIASIGIAIQSGGPTGPWYNAATSSFSNSAPVYTVISVANPGQPSSTWTYSFTPPPAGGSYQVFAYGVNSANIADVKGASVGFTVSPSSTSPSLILAPNYSPAGGTTNATVLAFAPHETVKFTMLGATVGTATTNVSGRAATTLKIPAYAALGAKSIAATGQTSHDTTSASFYVANSWTSLGGGPTHTFYESNDEIFQHVLSVHHGPQFIDEAWYAVAGSAVESSPAVVDGVAYFGNDQGIVFAVSTLDGVPYWTYQLLSGVPVKTGPALDRTSGLLSVTGTDGNLYELSSGIGGGALRAMVALGGNLTSPAVDKGTAFVGSDSGMLYSINEQGGGINWKATLSAPVHASPVADLADNVLVVGDDSGAVTAFNPASGTTLWSYKTNGAVTAALTIENGVVYAPSTDGNLYALSEQTGSLQWMYAAGAAIRSNVAFDTKAQLIYVGTSAGTLIALLPSGKKAFENTSSSTSIVSLVAVQSVVFGLRGDGTINAFRPGQQGNTLWVYQTKASSINSVPAVDDGALYVGAEDGGVYEFTPYGKPPDPFAKGRRAAPRSPTQPSM